METPCQLCVASRIGRGRMSWDSVESLVMKWCHIEESYCTLMHQAPTDALELALTLPSSSALRGPLTLEEVVSVTPMWKSSSSLLSANPCGVGVCVCVCVCGWACMCVRFLSETMVFPVTLQTGIETCKQMLFLRKRHCKTTILHTELHWSGCLNALLFLYALSKSHFLTSHRAILHPCRVTCDVWRVTPHCSVWAQYYFTRKPQVNVNPLQMLLMSWERNRKCVCMSLSTRQNWHWKGIIFFFSLMLRALTVTRSNMQ